MVKDILFDLFVRLQTHVAANKRKGKYHMSIFKAMDKYQRRVYYKRFYQIDKVIGSDKFFRYAGIVMWQYRDSYQIIAIQIIKNFTAYKIFNAYVGVFFDSYKHQTTNNFERLLEAEGVENNFIIMTPILIRIYIYIGPNGFLEDSALEVVFSIDRKIQKGLVIVC